MVKVVEVFFFYVAINCTFLLFNIQLLHYLELLTETALMLSLLLRAFD